jgi:hypothetical protein
VHHWTGCVKKENTMLRLGETQWSHLVNLGCSEAFNRVGRYRPRPPMRPLPFDSDAGPAEDC